MKTVDQILTEIERRADAHAEGINELKTLAADRADEPRRVLMRKIDSYKMVIVELLALKAFIQAEPPQPFPNGRFADKESGGV